jgi:ATP-binding cassette subfamily B multidrug efflux pump
VNLVLRFYELNAGRITLDGVDIARLPRADLRSEIGMVLQDTWLFGGTIRDNIAYGRDGCRGGDPGRGRPRTSTGSCTSLPDGYDTLINEEGSNLSAGEKQLITIARAFLSDPAC